MGGGPYTSPTDIHRPSWTFLKPVNEWANAASRYCALSKALAVALSRRICSWTHNVDWIPDNPQ